MPHAVELGTPEALAAIMGAIAFVAGLIVHALLRGRWVGAVSAAIALIFEILVSVTIYRDAFSTDAMAGVGSIFGFGIKFAAAFAAGLLVRRLRSPPPGGPG